jgi:hypothetical protein
MRGDFVKIGVFKIYRGNDNLEKSAKLTKQAEQREWKDGRWMSKAETAD